MEKLTTLQRKLIEDLINEFYKINKTEQKEGRFTLKTIIDCNNEEERFKETMTKHNLAMMNVLTAQFDDDIEAFKKEFGKVLDVQIGHFEYSRPHGTLDILTNATKEKPLKDNQYYEMNLFIVSKTKPYSGDSRSNYCNNMSYLQIYVDFKRERVIHVLESGKEVIVYKIVGLEYRRYQYLHKEKVINTSTLDELIQKDKEVQKKFVELAS